MGFFTTLHHQEGEPGIFAMNMTSQAYPLLAYILKHFQPFYDNNLRQSWLHQVQKLLKEIWCLSPHTCCPESWDRAWLDAKQKLNPYHYIDVKEFGSAVVILFSSKPTADPSISSDLGTQERSQLLLKVQHFRDFGTQQP